MDEKTKPDDSLTVEEWCNMLEDEPNFDRKGVHVEQGPLNWFFIICGGDIVMIPKEYWALLIEGDVSRET